MAQTHNLTQVNNLIWGILPISVIIIVTRLHSTRRSICTSQTQLKHSNANCPNVTRRKSIRNRRPGWKSVMKLHWVVNTTCQLTSTIHNHDRAHADHTLEPVSTNCTKRSRTVCSCLASASTTSQCPKMCPCHDKRAKLSQTAITHLHHGLRAEMTRSQGDPRVMPNTKVSHSTNQWEPRTVHSAHDTSQDSTTSLPMSESD